MLRKKNEEQRVRLAAVFEPKQHILNTTTDFFTRKGSMRSRSPEVDSSLHAVVSRLSPGSRRRSSRVAETFLSVPSAQFTCTGKDIAKLLLSLECATCPTPRQAPELRKRAVKLLSGETFDPADHPPAEAEVLSLYQKEELLNSVLDILAKDNVDTNALLLSAFEKIQCEHYVPPSGRPLLQNGYFVLEERVQSVPRRKEIPAVARELRLELSDADLSSKKAS